MLSNIFGGSSTEGPGAVSVKAANEQLGRMHGRNLELEQRIREQAELMHRREKEHGLIVRQLTTSKEEDAIALRQEMAQWQQRCAKTEEMLKERDVQIAYMLHRCSYLDEAASYAPLLDQLAQTLKNAFASQPPKIVQSVKPIITQSPTSNGTAHVNDRQQSTRPPKREQVVHTPNQPGIAFPVDSAMTMKQVNFKQ